MKTVQAKCVGISPLMMCRMTEEELEGLRTGVRDPIKRDVPREEVARVRLYTDDEGTVGIPIENLFACLVEAGRDVKVGTKQISTATTTKLPAYLSLPELFLPLIDFTPWVVDMRRGVNANAGKSGVACAVVRPKFMQWAFEVILEIDDKLMSLETARQLLEIAGGRHGLMAFRPNKKGPFGRFKVERWDEISQRAAA